MDPTTLTPEAVRNKQFTPTRFRPGYDEDEVDVFLDEVEAELNRLLSENAELRNELAAATAKGPAATGPATVTSPRAEPAAPPPPPPPPPREDPGSVALRTLQLAQRTAEEAVAAARAEAESIVGDAQNRAGRLEQESRDRTTRLEEESQRQRLTVIAELDRRRARLEAEVEELRAFEQEYRSRLRAYLESQLRVLEGEDDAAPDAVAASRPGAHAADDDSDDEPDIPRWQRAGFAYCQRRQRPAPRRTAGHGDAAGTSRCAWTRAGTCVSAALAAGSGPGAGTRTGARVGFISSPGTSTGAGLGTSTGAGPGTSTGAGLGTSTCAGPGTSTGAGLGTSTCAGATSGSAASRDGISPAPGPCSRATVANSASACLGAGPARSPRHRRGPRAHVLMTSG